MKLENRFTVPVGVDQAWRVLLDVERIAPCMPGATLTSFQGDHFEGTVKVKVGPINLTYGGKASFISKDETTHVAVIDGSGKETRGTGTAKALITCRLIDKGDTTEVEVDTDLNVTGKPAQFGRGVLADVSAKLVDQFAACLSEEIAASTPTGAPLESIPAGAPATAGVSGEPTAAVSPAGVPAAGAGGAVASALAGAAAAESAGAAAAGPAAERVGAGAGAGVGAGAGANGSPTGAAVGGASTGPGGAAGTAGAGARPAAARARQPAEPIDLLGTAGAPVLKRLAPVLAALVAVVLLVRRLRR